MRVELRWLRQLLCFHKYVNAEIFKADEAWMRGMPGYRKTFIVGKCSKCGHIFSCRLD